MPADGQGGKKRSMKHQDQTQASHKNESHATLGGKHGGKEDKGRIHEAA